MPSKKIKTYDRQPCDTDKSWIAFCRYRDMGTERTIRKLWESRGESGVKSPVSTLEMWSSQYHWVSRCRDFDNDELARQSIALQRDRTRRRIARERAADNYRIALANRARQMIDQPLRENWTERDLIALLEASDRFAVISYGGDTPQMPLLQAVEILVREGVIPDRILEVTASGVDDFTEMMRSAFNNLNPDAESGVSDFG